MGFFGKPLLFHNDEAVHSWDWTGEVETGTWGRAGIRCSRCGEERKVIGTGLDGDGLRYGCVRRARADRLRRYDMVLVPCDGYTRLDWVEKFLGDGLWLTRNAGGGIHRVREADFRRKPVRVNGEA